jgi:hypothetical protein
MTDSPEEVRDYIVECLANGGTRREREESARRTTEEVYRE